MTIGATTGKEPDYISNEDISMLSLDDMRGAYKDMHKAKLSLNQMASVEGVMTEISVLKQQLEMTHEQMRRLIGMYATLASEFKQYREQRIAELQMKVNYGSTTVDDED